MRVFEGKVRRGVRGGLEDEGGVMFGMRFWVMVAIMRKQLCGGCGSSRFCIVCAAMTILRT